ncbi:MAG: hypothetical protein ACE5GX_09360 [Thermoanaerobaculia bacterium]
MSVGSTSSPIRIHLCRRCCERPDTASDRDHALELAAMALVQRHLVERFSKLVDGLSELLPFLDAPRDVVTCREPGREPSEARCDEGYSKS